jgi:cation diffusion facilitator CzcD-associated flavoprotein CzcO
MTTTVEPLNGNLRKRPRVALIGCGASGMCFLHALYTRHKRGDSVLLPYVVCYEQALEPGGCWRYVPEQDRNLSHNSACWYSDVWTNVSKEMYEFFDYNFEQHFSGRAVPSFLPRKDAFHYFKQRTLSIDQGLLDKGVHEIHELHYGTIVTNVTFDSDTQLFTVATAPLDPFADKRHVYQPTEEQEFDYCIWAAGTRGKPRIPRSLLTLFRSGQSLVDPEVCDPPFTGTILHSIHVPTPEFPPAVIGKRIVLIGDSDSALDLALHAVKLGVSKVDILSRSGYGECFYMSSWPEKVDPDTGDYEQIVDVHVAMPFRVIDDGRSIVGGPVIWNHIGTFILRLFWILIFLEF